MTKRKPLTISELPHSLVAAAKLVCSMYPDTDTRRILLDALITGYEAGVEDTRFEMLLEGTMK